MRKVSKKVVMMKARARVIRHLNCRPMPPGPRMTAQHLEPGWGPNNDQNSRNNDENSHQR